MTNDPEQGPDDESNNPFKGTPFEEMFSTFGNAFGMGGAGAAGMPDLSMIMSQIQSMMSPHEGSVNWTLAKDVARRTVAQEPDPSASDKDRADVADALRLADHWLDSATEFPSGITSTAAWSRAEWIEETVDGWRRLVEPVAEHVVSAMGNVLPQEAQAMAGPLLGFLNQAGGAMFGQQVGQALGGLAGEGLSASGIGLPLGPGRRAPALSAPRPPAPTAAPRCSPRTSGPSPRDSTSTPPTYCSTSRSGRPPISGCSRTGRGWGGPSSWPLGTTVAAPTSTSRRASPRCVRSIPPTRPRSRRPSR